MKTVINLKKKKEDKNGDFCLIFFLLSPREASDPSVGMQVVQTSDFAFHAFRKKETLWEVWEETKNNRQ